MDSQVSRWDRGELPGNLTKRNRGHGAANNEEKKSDEWVEDPDSDIMDAKVSF